MIVGLATVRSYWGNDGEIEPPGTIELSIVNERERWLSWEEFCALYREYIRVWNFITFLALNSFSHPTSQQCAVVCGAP